MKEELEIEQIGGTLVLKITKHYKDKYKLKKGDKLLVDFKDEK